MTRISDTEGRKGFSRAELDQIVSDPATPAHIKSIYAAVRDYHIHHVLLTQNEKSFNIAQLKEFGPMVVIIGDDTNCALGPSAFDQSALRVLIGKSTCVAIIASMIVPDIYKCLSLMAGLFRVNAIIIETRPEQEMAWREYVRGVSPNASILHSMAGA
jgi:hypothetical protein